MEDYFGPQGLLARNVASFEFRTSQLEMAAAIFQCLREDRVLLAEAGTGTGKTWAYLIPAILSGKKVVVSTGTKTLQDQILDHDIPFLKKLLFPQLCAVCLKGRKNYLCRRRFRDFVYQPTLYNKEEVKLFQRFQKWASRTLSGDRAEIDWLPDHFQTWNEVSCNSDQCLGQQCEDQSRCFLTLLRQNASRAHLLVVNHHLFFADLALRHRGLGEIIPDYDAVVFDEAHQLEDIIGLYFGVAFSNLKISEFIRDLQRELSNKSIKLKKPEDVLNIAQHLDVLGRRFYRHFSAQHPTHGRYPLESQKVSEEFHEIGHDAIHTLQQLGALLTSSRESEPVVESFNRRAVELSQTISEILQQKDPGLVYWYEMTSNGVFIHGTPIAIASVLQETLFRVVRAVVLSSATLAVAGSFQFLRDSLGLPEASREMLVTSPFAYEKQTLLYIPSRFPAPQEPSFCSEVARRSLKILDKTQGRALFLFTSYRHLNQVYQLLQNQLPYPILVQGQKSKRALLAEFKEKIDSVLLATSSFWQGIDVPGEALSCLLIDKLPFEPPDDPVTAARMEQIAKQGASPFFHYQVPRAIISLKQGVGRLIRSSQDRGIIVIFDVRLMTKGYGRLFLKSLPPCQIVHHLREIDDFLSVQGLDDHAEPGRARMPQVPTEG